MHWVAPTEKDALTETLERRLWDSADQFRAKLPRLLSGQVELETEAA